MSTKNAPITHIYVLKPHVGKAASHSDYTTVYLSPKSFHKLAPLCDELGVSVQDAIRQGAEICKATPGAGSFSKQVVNATLEYCEQKLQEAELEAMQKLAAENNAAWDA